MWGVGGRGEALNNINIRGWVVYARFASILGWICEVCFDIGVDLRGLLRYSGGSARFASIFGWICEVWFDVRVDVRGLV